MSRKCSRKISHWRRLKSICGCKQYLYSERNEFGYLVKCKYIYNMFREELCIMSAIFSQMVKKFSFPVLETYGELNHNLDTCTSLLIATLFIIEKYWHQLTDTKGDWLKHGISQNGFICNCKKISLWRFLTIPKNAQTTAQLHPSHSLVK